MIAALAAAALPGVAITATRERFDEAKAELKANWDSYVSSWHNPEAR